MLKQKIGVTENKIYARKTIIKELKNNEIIKFLNENHLQGFVNGNVNLGLFFNEELVSIMTFGKKRLSLGYKNNIKGEYELLRFCNKINTNVIGGASKLFNYFIKNFDFKNIISYADRSWSIGNIYKLLGFNLIGKTEPNYFYIIDDHRENRFKYRKDKLIIQGFDSTKSEHEIMIERGYFRIYNSGNLKFIYEK
jgi:hypothetical protein